MKPRFYKEVVNIYFFRWIFMVIIVWIIGAMVGGLMLPMITNSVELVDAGVFIGFVCASIVNYFLIKRFA